MSFDVIGISKKLGAEILGDGFIQGPYIGAITETWLQQFATEIAKVESQSCSAMLVDRALLFDDDSKKSFNHGDIADGELFKKISWQLIVSSFLLQSRHGATPLINLSKRSTE